MVEAPLRAGLRVIARPDARVQGVDRLPVVQWRAGHDLAQPVGVHLSRRECVVGAAPAAPEERRQAQVDKRRHGTGKQQRVEQLEQRIPAPPQGSIDLLTKHPQRFTLTPVDHARPYRDAPPAVPEPRSRSPQS